MSRFFADLHLHSAYARATSPNLNFDTLAQWAKFKGINLLASADFTHPVWWQETKRKLKESKKPGFFEYAGINFVLGTEISCIYSQGGRLRRTHCLVYFPEKEDVEKFNQQIGRIGNLRADGRPILGISAKQLLEIALNVNEKAIFIPAHVWTPWFSLYGSNSGFDSIEEAFSDLSKYIYAVETGLSSDPAMNWRIKELDSRSIVSFSDAHSCPKMGREATVFDTDFSYDGLSSALKSAGEEQVLSAEDFQTRPPTKSATSRSSTGSGEDAKNPTEAGLAQTGENAADIQKPAPKISFTIEFFPEEGKYHYTGHRNCNVRHSPSETARQGIICPNCKKKLTIGVMHRVEELAEKQRKEAFKSDSRPPFIRLVPLLEIIAESLEKQIYSSKVQDEFNNLIKKVGSEIDILLNAKLADIDKATTVFRIVEGIKKVREGNIIVEPGYDGVYGVVKIWNDKKLNESGKNQKKESEEKQAEGQVGLFD